MAAALPALHQATVPEYGVIVGGKLHGWEYTLLHAGVVGGRAYLAVQAHAPAWPFPLPIEPTKLFDADFTELQQHREAKRVKKRDINTMIKAAVAAQEAALP